MQEVDNRKVIKRFLNAGLIVFAAGYIYVLLKIVLFKYGLSSEMGSINMVPFSFIKMFHDGTGLGASLKSIIRNIAIFIPMGIFGSLIYKKNSRVPVCISVFICTAFEVIQGITGCGDADIDDIILSIFGVVLGVLIYKFILKKLDNKMTLPAATVCFFLIFGFAGRTALHMIAPNMMSPEVMFENEELLQGRNQFDCDIHAVCTGVDDGIVYLRPDSIHAGNGDDSESLLEQYPLSKDAGIIVAHKSFKYSSDGNIRKITIKYTAENETSVGEIIENEKSGFIDMWIDQNDECTMMIFEVFEK